MSHFRVMSSKGEETADLERRWWRLEEEKQSKAREEIERRWNGQEEATRRKVEKKQEKQRWEEHNNREEKKEKESQRWRKEAFVRFVRQQGEGRIGLMNNTARSIKFTSVRFLLRRSQVCIW